MEQKDNDKRKRDITPIIDGDARPDIDLNPEDERRKNKGIIPIPGENKEAIATKNRNDENSLENFRDAKQE